MYIRRMDGKKPEYLGDNRQPQCLNIEICYQEIVKYFYQKYGLDNDSKLPGTNVPANFKYRTNLERIIEKHYALTRFKDARDQVMEIRKIFDGGLL